VGDCVVRVAPDRLAVLALGAVEVLAHFLQQEAEVAVSVTVVRIVSVCFTILDDRALEIVVGFL
jgi:hypothetical protein